MYRHMLKVSCAVSNHTHAAVVVIMFLGTIHGSVVSMCACVCIYARTCALARVLCAVCVCIL